MTGEPTVNKTPPSSFKNPNVNVCFKEYIELIHSNMAFVNIA